MREQALFEAGKKDQRELQALGGVQRHQRHARLGIELVGVGGQRGVVEEFGQCFAAHFGIVRGVGQFLQVLNAAECLRRAFGFQSLDVAGAVDDEADQLRQCRGDRRARGRLRTVLSSDGGSSLSSRTRVSRVETWGTRVLTGPPASASSGMAAWACLRMARSGWDRAAESGFRFRRS